MNDVSNITNKIIADAKAEAERIAAQAEKESAEIMEQYSAQAEAAYEKIIEDSRKKCDAIKGTALAKIEMSGRMEKLACRREIVESVFKDAYAHIQSMSQDEYVEFMKNSLNRVLSGTSEKTGAGMEIIMNAADRETVASKLIEDTKISVSEQVLNTKGGYVLRDGETEFNFTYEVLFKAAAEKYEDGVVGILFAGK